MMDRSTVKKASFTVFLIVIATFAFVMYRNLGGQDATGPEVALPALGPQEEHFVMKISDMQGAREMLDSAAKLASASDRLGALSDIARGANLPPMPDISTEDMKTALGAIKILSSIADAADQLALSATKERVIAAITSTADRSKKMLETIGAKRIGEERDDKWVLDLDGPARLLITRRVAGSRALLVMADDDESMASALSAVDNNDKRAKIARRSDKPNFVSYYLNLDLPSGSRKFSGETSWQSAKGEVRIECNSDPDTSLKYKTSGVESDAVPIYGNGEPTIFSAIDVPFLASLALPYESDPVEAFVTLIEKQAGTRIPRQYRSSIINSLKTARLSTGFAFDKVSVEPSLAYVLLETEDTSLVDPLFGMAMFLGLENTSIGGWKQALKADMGSMVGHGPMDVVLAKSDRRILIGIGDQSAYAKTGKRPSAMSGMPEKGSLSSFYLDLNYLLDPNTAIGRRIREELKNDPTVPQHVLDALDKIAVKSIAFVMSSPEKSEIIVKTSN